MTHRNPFASLLKAYSQADPMEQKRVGYMVMVVIGMLGLFCGLTLIHFAFGMHAVHYLGDLGAIACLLSSLYLISRGRDTEAGATIIWSLVGIIFVYGVLVDYFAGHHVEFLRLYLTLFSILGVYILIISVFKDFEEFFLLAVIFTLITMLHTLTIIFQNGGPQSMTNENWSYFVAAIGTINVAAFITYITSKFNKELMAENRLNIQKIQQQNLNLNELVEQQTSELKDSNERLRSFAHIASHDLKEPLRSISGFVTLIQKHLRQSYPDDHTLDEYMAFVTHGTKRMGILINDVLAFSKLDTRKREFELIDLNEVLARIVTQLDTTVTSQKAVIEYGNLPFIIGQQNLISQVFFNLVTNAMRYARPGQPPVVRIAGSTKSDLVEITIKDNGTGISEDMLSRIFMPYYWHTPGTPDESAGMGLAVCRKIVEFHGGSIWAESVVGEGSVFHCCFPLPSEEVSG